MEIGDCILRDLFILSEQKRKKKKKGGRGFRLDLRAGPRGFRIRLLLLLFRTLRCAASTSARAKRTWRYVSYIGS